MVWSLPTLQSAMPLLKIYSTLPLSYFAAWKPNAAGGCHVTVSVWYIFTATLHRCKWIEMVWKLVGEQGTSKELIFVCGVEIGTVIPVGRRLEEWQVGSIIEKCSWLVALEAGDSSLKVGLTFSKLAPHYQLQNAAHQRQQKPQWSWAWATPHSSCRGVWLLKRKLLCIALWGLKYYFPLNVG